jgi:hypothetical protein
MIKKTYTDLALKFHPDKNAGCSAENLILAKEKMQALTTNRDAQIEKYGVLSEESLNKCRNNNNNANANTNTNANAASNQKCSQNASLLSTVPPECIIPGPVPQYHDLMKAAIEYPIHMAAEAGAEVATDTLKATGNAALVKIATQKALGLEDAKLLNEMSKDPKVAAELEKFQNNMSGVVEESIKQLGDKIQEPVQNAAEQLATGIITTGTSALASVSGPLVPLATIAGTAGQLVNEVTEITKAVEGAQNKVGQAMSQVTGLTHALDEAAKNAIPKVELPDVPKVEVPKVELPDVPKVEVPEV